MPYSFTEIETKKSRIIYVIFFALCVLYVLMFYVTYVGGKFVFLGFKSVWVDTVTFPSTGLWIPFTLTIKELLAVAGMAALVAVVHWSYVTRDMISRVLYALRAQVLDQNDSYHQMFQNILQEVSIATGGKKFEGVVIPTMATNAFAASDFDGRMIIGVTEGLLARLTRAQMEAVVGHEAAHVLRGDSLETTLTVSLFALWQDFLKGIPRKLPRFRMSSSRFGIGFLYAVVVFMIVYAILSLATLCGLMLNMFISRQREFRADATSVRLTRNPLALAEALYVISYRWRGAGLPGEQLGALFIVNQKYSRLEEGEGLLSDLFSTHPPVRKRLAVLLDMAHADENVLQSALTNDKASPQTTVNHILKLETPKWLFHAQGDWKGPFGLAEIASFEWIVPEMMVKKLGDETVRCAWDDQQIRGVLADRKTAAEVLNCPRCHVALDGYQYESALVYQCPACQGVLVTENNLTRIIARQDVGFSDETKAMALKMQKENALFKRTGPDYFYVQDGLTCPHCRHLKGRMFRSFYSVAYHVEIDKCIFCGLVWFDKNELEILQYLIENATETKDEKRKEDL